MTYHLTQKRHLTKSNIHYDLKSPKIRNRELPELDSIYQKHPAKTVLNGERWNAFPVRLEKARTYTLKAIQIVLEVLAAAIKQEKELRYPL